jgi:hypothetical protein
LGKEGIFGEGEGNGISENHTQSIGDDSGGSGDGRGPKAGSGSVPLVDIAVRVDELINR